MISITPHLRRQKNKLKTNQEIREEEDLKEKAEQIKKVSLEISEDGPILTTNQQEQLPLPVDDEGVLDQKMQEMFSDLELPADAVPLVEDNEGQDQEPGIDQILQELEDHTGETSGESFSGQITEYAKAVQQKIAQRISFPFQAKEEGWEGVVTLSLTILSDGTLNDVELKESSGYSVFDNDAVNTAQIVAPFNPFPVEVDMDELTVSIPVAYNQEAL